jgi:hypothetical protein
MEYLMDYVLVDFRQLENVRQFSFSGTSADKERLNFTVGVNLAAIRSYGITMQELPLLCRRFLEEKPVLEQERKSMFSESRMADYARHRDEEKRETEQRRKGFRKPPRPAPAG